LPGRSRPAGHWTYTGDGRARPHGAIEIAIPRAEYARLRGSFDDLSLFAAGEAGWMTWVSHRDPRIRRPEAVGCTADGIPYLRPEIVLFTKAKRTRDKDEADFAATLPELDQAGRVWLAQAFATAHPGHRWLARIDVQPVIHGARAAPGGG
jgi:hypothetical protein